MSSISSITSVVKVVGRESLATEGGTALLTNDLLVRLSVWFASNLRLKKKGKQTRSEENRFNKTYSLWIELVAWFESEFCV